MCDIRENMFKITKPVPGGDSINARGFAHARIPRLASHPRDQKAVSSHLSTFLCNVLAAPRKSKFQQKARTGVAIPIFFCRESDQNLGFLALYALYPCAYILDSWPYVHVAPSPLRPLQAWLSVFISTLRAAYAGPGGGMP